MKIFLDTSLVNNETKGLIQFVEGITFNQKIVKNENTDYYTSLDKFANDYDKEVSVQFPLTFNLMKDYKTAKDLWELNKQNIVIKLPSMFYGVQLFNRLKKDFNNQMKINLTMNWKYEQLIFASILKPFYISIFDYSAQQEQDSLLKSKFKSYMEYLLNKTSQLIIVGQIRDLKTAVEYIKNYATTDLIMTLKPALLTALIKKFSDEITQKEKEWTTYYHGGNA